ncbi:MAG: ParB/RepB/Spo0J family partition protein [Planctomycetes bacterium]|nr:ParB/RepB/Spo0J family partition protein [Planctomycetota bacterium]MCC7397448.1 ParB/RepB/Spo0J family partition protein [Planctomycetota bacterium]
MVDRRLGRGLDFFLSGGRSNQAQPAAQAESSAPAGTQVEQIEVSKLVPNPHQPRKLIAESDLQSLADSIRASGILQPILARKDSQGRFEIVAGERRWRAAQIAGLQKVPVIVRELKDQDSAIFALVENVQREDLNAIEKAEGFQLLMQKMGATQEEVAKQVGFERSTVANFLRLLDLPDAVQAHVSRGTLSMGHGRALLALSDREAIELCAEEAVRAGLSVRALEAKVKELLEVSKGDPTKVSAAASKKARPVWLNELEESLVEALGTPVSIRYGRKRSQIIIECAGREEFERVFQRLKEA